MLLLVPGNKTDDDYRRWSAEIGKSSNLGVQIQVAIRYSDRPGPHVVATGVVGVPRPPEDDMERQILACKLADLVETPDIAIFALTGYLRWRLVRGGPFEVELTECRQVRELDESEISDRISLSGPGPMSEPVFRAKPAESAHWEREYRANRYLRFESRAALNQRYQDLLTNIKILTDKGKVTLTDQNRWHRLFRHVVEEMLIRGEPPVPHNFDPHIAPAVLFSDQDFCARAADAVANVTIAGPCLVKYGQKEHMRDLYHRGEVHMCTASHYRDPDYNQAVHDQELIIMQCGVVSSKSGYMKSHDVSADPDLLDELGPRFLPLYRASDAARDELVWGLARAPDAWIYCMSDSLAPRLFFRFPR